MLWYVLDVFILFVKLTPTLIIAFRCLRPDDRKIVIVQAVECTYVPYRVYTSAPITSMYIKNEQIKPKQWFVINMGKFLWFIVEWVHS